MSNSRSKSLIQIRAHLEGKSSRELVELLLDLASEMDEPTRQHFWARLASRGLATADLRYSSPQDFLEDLETLAEEVEEGGYYDEDAARYFGADSQPSINRCWRGAKRLATGRPS
jgi:hypothetical protein